MESDGSASRSFQQQADEFMRQLERQDALGAGDALSEEPVSSGDTFQQLAESFLSQLREGHDVWGEGAALSKDPVLAGGTDAPPEPWSPTAATAFPEADDAEDDAEDDACVAPGSSGHMETQLKHFRGFNVSFNNLPLSRSSSSVLPSAPPPTPAPTPTLVALSNTKRRQLERGEEVRKRKRGGKREKEFQEQKKQWQENWQ